MEEAGIDAVFLPPSGDLEYVLGVRRQRAHATDDYQYGDWLYGAWISRQGIRVVVPWVLRHYVENQLQAAGADLGTESRLDLLVLPEIPRPTGPVEAWVRERHWGRVAVGKRAPARLLVELAGAIGGPWVDAEPLIAPMRAIKGDDEIALMRRAAEVVDVVYQQLLSVMRVGMTEADVASEIDARLVRAGSEGTSFVTGVMLSRPGAAPVVEAVGRAGSARLDPGTIVALDFGCVVDGYANDFGRTIYMGSVSPRHRRIHDIVAAAQRVGMKTLRPGIPCQAVDATVRDFLAAHGYPHDPFHRLGHGIGRDVHEPPFLEVGDETPVAPGMTFTVEPSIYVAGDCLIRYEDVVRVTDRGCEPLNRADPTLAVITAG